MERHVPETDGEWRERLTPAQYRVLRRAGTEPPFTGAYDACHAPGTYRCAGCDSPLFAADAKFDSGTGWPSFVAPVDDERLALRRQGLILRRTEVRCATCDSHLGHVFADGPRDRGGQRYCINSLALALDSEA